MGELKPCPFCGGGVDSFHDFGLFASVECRACGAEISTYGTGTAHFHWNLRAERPGFCSLCGSGACKAVKFSGGYRINCYSCQLKGPRAGDKKAAWELWLKRAEADP